MYPQPGANPYYGAPAAAAAPYSVPPSYTTPHPSSSYINAPQATPSGVPQFSAPVPPHTFVPNNLPTNNLLQNRYPTADTIIPPNNAPPPHTNTAFYPPPLNTQPSYYPPQPSYYPPQPSPPVAAPPAAAPSMYGSHPPPPPPSSYWKQMAASHSVDQKNLDHLKSEFSDLDRSSMDLPYAYHK